MCGICGYVRFRGDRPPQEMIKRMLGSLSHRGPDGTGLYSDRYATLGHTRLSIIDLAGGTQPMSNETGTLWISFNGEIYNYIEIRETLIGRGHEFRTSSDTEVIVHAWEEWGIEALSRFNGQWGLALWDTVRQELVLSVDPYGIRPVYYTASDRSLEFASEIKALFQNPAAKRELDPQGLSDVYTTWGLIGERTCFLGVRRLMPGSYLAFGPEGIRKGSYRSPELSQPRSRPAGNLEDLVDSALEQAVNLRFTRSDVPVGAYLSGGLDSSIIVSLIKNRTNVPLKTFSIRFGDGEYDEGDFQKALSDDLGTDHHSVHVGNGEMMAAFPDVIRHTEQPILRTAPIPMFLLSRLVRSEGIKVVVTGEGADEFFAGYDVFRETVVRSEILNGENESRIDELINRLYPWMKRAPGAAGGMGRSFFERNLAKGDPFMSHRTRWDNGTPVLSMLDPGFQNRGDTKSSVTECIEIPADFMNWSPLFQAQWLEIRTLLNGYLLSAQGDRMLMANSVEGRFPFLDPNVTTLANSLPDAEKLTSDFVEKHILKQTFQGTIPERIKMRPKQPYRAPDAAAIFTQEPSRWMSELMSPEYIESTGIFRTSVVSGLFDKCRKNAGNRMSNRDNMMAVAAVSTLILHDEFISGFHKAEVVEPGVVIDRRP